MRYSQESLQEVCRQITSTIRKLEQALQTLESKEDPKRYRSQLTLVRRRIEAFTIAEALVRQELEELPYREDGGVPPFRR